MHNDKINILMVDDQPAKLLSYEVILEELGENLIKASSGKEALEHLLKSEVAVVLMDVSMPDMDGFEIAEIIRQHQICDLGLVDQLHAWYTPIEGLEVDYITRTAFGLHFYDSMLVIEKRRLHPPQALYTGEPSLPLNASELQFLARMDMDGGRRSEALAKYRSALEAQPDDAELRRIVATLEAAPR